MRTQKSEAQRIRVQKRRWYILRSWADMRRLFSLLWPHASPHKHLLFVGGLLSAFLIALRLAQPWPLKMVIDSLSKSKPLIPWLHLDWMTAIIVMSLLYLVVSILAALAEYWQLILLSGIGNKILFSFRTQLFRHTLAQSISFHDKRDIGELVTRIVSDTARLRRGINGILVRSFQVFFTFLASIGVVLWLDWRIAIILGVCGSLALFAMGKTGRRILRAARRNRRREGQLAAIVAEDAHGIRELQTFRPQQLADERFERRNVKSLKEEQKVRRLGAGLMFRMEILLTFIVCLALAFGAIGVNAGSFSLGSLVLVVHYIVGLYGPFRRFAAQAAQSGRTMACADRLVKVMETVPAVQNAPNARQAVAVEGTISFENVSYKSSKIIRSGRKWLLDDVSFQIKPGERVAVIGSNGAGKSSLLRLLLRLDETQTGRIAIDGSDIREYTIESIRGHFSVVFQHGIFFTLTVAENMTLGNPDATPDQVKETARRCGINEWIESLKKGYDTPVRRQGNLFSGGEKQKIAIARAMLRNGQIWLLDEPTQSLDSASSEGLTKLLLEATHGRTTLWITHDHAIIDYCDRVLVMHEGKVAFFGTTDDFGRWSKRGLQDHEKSGDIHNPLPSIGAA